MYDMPQTKIFCTFTLSNKGNDLLEIEMLESMEIFVAKANALMSRAAARDLFDFTNQSNNDGYW